MKTKSDTYATISFSAIALAMLCADCLPVLGVIMLVGIAAFVLAERWAG